MNGTSSPSIQTMCLVAFMRMLVPAPLRRENQIAVFHDHFLAVDVGVGAVALEDEAKRRHGVAMAGRHFAGLNQLKGQQHRVAGHLGFGHAGIDQANHPPLDAAAGDGNFFLALEPSCRRYRATSKDGALTRVFGSDGRSA